MTTLKKLNSEGYQKFNINALKSDYIIALAGNPNTGKSTIFNSLTGLRQHTGNWPGKTVTYAQGQFSHLGKSFLVIDLPGTYSLLANSDDEIIARDFICFGKPDTTLVVNDATNLERNLNLTLQVLEATDNVVVCINLLDEAERKKIKLDLDKLEKKLGVPVIGTAASKEIGINKLKDAIYNVATNAVTTNPYKLSYSSDIENLITEISSKLKDILQQELNYRWIALRIIEGDLSIINAINKYLSNNKKIDQENF